MKGENYNLVVWGERYDRSWDKNTWLIVLKKWKELKSMMNKRVDVPIMQL